MSKFKVGDIIEPNRELERIPYRYTGKDMISAKVLNVITLSYDQFLDVVVTDHENKEHISGETYRVSSKYFNVLEKKVSDIRVIEDEKGIFIIINEKTTIFVKGKKEDVSVINLKEIKQDTETAMKLAIHELGRNK